MATQTYTYDPTLISSDSVFRLRFELSDTNVADSGRYCLLSDQEIAGALTLNNGSIRRTRTALLGAIVLKLAKETDFSVGGLSISLNPRYEKYLSLFETAQKESRAIGGFSAPALTSMDQDLSANHYFYEGMHDNPQA